MKGLKFFVFALLAGLASSALAEEKPQEVRIVGVEAGYKDNVYLKTTDNSFRLDIFGYGQL